VAAAVQAVTTHSTITDAVREYMHASVTEAIREEVYREALSVLVEAT